MSEASADKAIDSRPHSNNPTADAHGRAAVVLVESLIHGLIARSVISVSDAIEIVDGAADARDEISFETGESLLGATSPSVLLRSIAASLAPDLPADPVIQAD